jgi:hypothetical protein
LKTCKSLLVFVIAAVLTNGGPISAQSNIGTIKGHVRLSGKAPGNVVIRMGVDPKCSQMNVGKRVLQEAVVVSQDRGLSNAFVRLQGTFPATPVPNTPVTISQRGCVYGPRVVGVRVGQTLQIRNDDPLLHNVHSVTARNSSFNVGQATAGVVYNYRPRAEETMLKLGCDVHRWMVAFIGVVNHPYFAVSARDGAFEIQRAPAGSHTIQVWHERYGMLTQTVRVKGGSTTIVDFTYSGTEKPPP